jgi:hypothetical protein
MVEVRVGGQVIARCVTSFDSSILSSNTQHGSKHTSCCRQRHWCENMLESSEQDYECSYSCYRIVRQGWLCRLELSGAWCVWSLETTFIWVMV